MSKTAIDRTEGVGTVSARPQFPVLDTLRAVGALAVLTTHTSFQAGDYLRHGVVGTLLARLDVGVAIFFVLSGFLLSRPYLASGVGAVSRPATGRYYEKRLLRIYPVYVVTVVVALLFVPENGTPSLRTWVTTLLLGNVYVDEQLPHGLTHMWSLAAEVAFYAVLPLLMMAAVGRRGLESWRVLGVLGALAGISVLWHLVIEEWLDPRVEGSPNIWLPAYLTWFAVGIGLAWAHVRLEAGSRSRAFGLLPRAAALPGVCWSVVAGLMLLVATPIAGPTLFQVGTAGESLAKHLVYAAIGGVIVLTGVWAVPGGRYARVMSTPALRHLGLISYSIFCIHLSVISLVMWFTGYDLFHGHGIQIWLLTVAITLVAAELLYRFVELPFLRIKSRVRPTSSADTTDAATTPTTR